MKKTFLKKAGYLLAASVFLAGMLPGISHAKPEYGKQEGKPCTFCHPKPKELNDAGKYYQEKKTLKGFEAKK